MKLQKDIISMLLKRLVMRLSPNALIIIQSSKRTIALPFYNNLKEEQIDHVCENLKKIIQSR